MNGTVPSREARRWLGYVAIGVVMLAVLTLLAARYLNSGRFQEQMRRKVVAELEQMTGARGAVESLISGI